MGFSILRGTKDILPDEMGYWHHIESTCRDIMNRYHVSEIRTPIFEMTELFQRGIGDQTEIVEKEMYTFLDKGDRSITLRPEGTAAVVRAFIQNRLYREGNETKLYYCGPMFRYERPQSGRYRQFHQFGVEYLGSNHPATDAEVIALGFHLFQALGIKNLKVYINSLGDSICRPVIEERIKQFLAANLKHLPEVLQKKFEKNPLRILDSKDEKVQLYLSGMPNMYDALSQNSKDHFNLVLEYLDHLGIPIEVKPTLVRGLEYYTETVFEIVSDDLGGAQNTLCGGGRYNHLVEELGGPKSPAVGFAFGMERAVMLLQEQKVALPKSAPLVFLAPIGISQQATAFYIMENLRKNGIKCEMDYTKTDLSPLLKRANKLGASIVLIIGETEAENNEVLVKNMKTKTQTTVSQKSIMQVLENELKSI